MHIAFQGVHGAYSELAAQELFGARANPLPVDSFDDVFAAVNRGRAAYGIIPIENSLAGSIHQNYDLLLAHSLNIVKEVHLRIEHALMCLPSSSLKKIRSVRSHPQALAQCTSLFIKHKGIKPEPYFDTAGAAQSIAEEQLADTAAIAGAHAAKLYGLKILKRNIESRKHNFTRFLAIAKSPARMPTGSESKTSIVFAPRSNQTGILYRILGVFSLRNIDLLKIESRPDPQLPFEYLFYIDFAGGPKQREVVQAIDQLEKVTRTLRVLGTYPMGRGNFYGAQRRV